jgi:hypothetical protein
MLVNGSLVETITRLYCIDHVFHPGAERPEEMVFRCPADQPSGYKHSRQSSDRTLYSSVGGFSLLCLFATGLVYGTLPSFRNLHGRIVLMNVLCIALVTIFIIVLFNSEQVSGVVCTAIGYTGYFSSLAMFGWMTVQNAHLTGHHGVSDLAAKDYSLGYVKQGQLDSGLLWRQDRDRGQRTKPSSFESLRLYLCSAVHCG